MPRPLLAVAATLTALSVAPRDARAEDTQEPPMVYYPYPTSYTEVDPGYQFDDDLLTGQRYEPYIMPIVWRRTVVRRTMITPRLTFVRRMYVQSLDL